MLILTAPLASALLFGSPLASSPRRALPQDPMEVKESLVQLGLATKLYLAPRAASTAPRQTASVFSFSGLETDSWQEMGLVRNVRIQSPDPVIELSGLSTASWQEMGAVIELPYRTKAQSKPAVVKLDPTIPALSPGVRKILAPSKKKQANPSAEPARAQLIDTNM
jgi:hypothetical protein